MKIKSWLIYDTKSSYWKRVSCLPATNQEQRRAQHIIMKQSNMGQGNGSNREAAKRSVVNHLVSLPTMLRSCSLSILLESEYRGTFGSISVARLTFMKDLVALKRISMDFSDNLDIMAELRTIHALAGHPLFPHCFGYVLPNVIVLQLLGRYENGVLTVETVDKLKMVDEAIKNSYLCQISYQIIEGIRYMHQLGLLHNDIKGNNAIIYNQQVKIVDFGKVP